MSWDAAPDAVSSASVPIYAFLGLCLLILVAGALVRAIVMSFGGSSGSDDD